MTNELVYWIWLSLHTGAGSELGSYLLRHFPTPRAVYDATEEELRRLDGIDDAIVSVLSDRDLSLSQRILEYCERVNVGIMTLDSALYPDRLRAIHAKPILLYYRGRVPKIDDNVMIACVGTRDCSDAGRANAKKLGHELAVGGAIVVSGMARGIDSAAQEAALEAGGHTIAVLGCGIDRAYPRHHKRLSDEIAEYGAVITEYAPGTPPNHHNFPARNRLISALSEAVLVIQGGETSGALITARYALLQGKSLFAVPGNIDHPEAAGPNLLLRAGARVALCAEDILSHFRFLYREHIGVSLPDEAMQYSAVTPEKLRAHGVRPVGEESTKKAKRVAKEKEEEVVETTTQMPVSLLAEAVESLDARQREIYALLPETPFTVDHLVAAGIPAGESVAAMTLFEILGIVSARPGGTYQKAEA